MITISVLNQSSGRVSDDAIRSAIGIINPHLKNAVLQYGGSGERAIAVTGDDELWSARLACDALAQPAAPAAMAMAMAAPKISIASDRLPVSDLRPGDVMLYRGTSLIAKGLRIWDGGEVSHAAVWAGEGVAEATGEGVNINTLEHSYHDTEWIKIFRLKEPVETMDPVVKRAKHYTSQGGRYAYEQILLLAMLAATRRAPVTPTFGILLRKILDTAAEAVNKFVSSIAADKREPMICSELVYRCYDEVADVDKDPYRILLGPGLEVAHSMMVPGMPVQNFERGSLMDAIEKTATVPGAAAMAMAAPQLATAEAAPVEESLDELLARYEVESQNAKPGGTVTVTPDLRNSLTRFTAALDRTKNVPVPAAIAEAALAAPAVSADPVKTILAYRKNFVTPADIYRSPSLRYVGTLAL